MKPQVFMKPAFVAFGGAKLTDHNRAPVGVQVERIEEKVRMANGTMRKYIVADKHTFSLSWTDLPHSKDYTVDGFWGGREIINFFNSQSGPFNLVLTNGDGIINTYSVLFASGPQREVKKRGFYDFWDLSIELEEV